MGSKSKAKKSSSSASAPAPTKIIDPTLALLFESSFGAVKAPEKLKNAPRKRPTNDRDGNEDGGDDDDSADADEDISPGSEEGWQDDFDSDVEAGNKEVARSRKRKRLRENADLEGDYMRKLLDEEEQPLGKKHKAAKKAGGKSGVAEEDEAESDAEADHESAIAPQETFPIKHESLINQTDEELDKSARTIFLGNVPTSAISSKCGYILLKRFFSEAGKISSVRFRSVAFSEQIPRKAAFVNHKLHEKQKAVNAYIVYKEVASARAALKLNGSVVLGHHVRVDSVVHPAKHEPKRCIFIGNLDFEAQEENLWKHFLPCGKVESVRVVRDSKTNVGKGFAYVQFEDAMSVEQALLLDGKKMEGDRKLRVTRAKSIKRNPKDARNRKPAQQRQPAKAGGYVPKADPKQQATLGRATKLLGKAGAAQLKKQVTVFEGLRATATTDSGIKKGGSGKKSGKSRARAIARSSAWKQKSKGSAKK